MSNSGGLISEMIRFSHSHPYLFFDLYLVFWFLACILLCPARQRRPMFYSAFLFLPFSFTALLLVPEYWKPKLLWDLPVGVEDFIFCFTCGGIAWFLAGIFMKDRWVLPLCLKPRLPRFIACLLFGSLIAHGFRVAGMEAMVATLLGLYILGFSLLVLQNKLWRVVLPACGIFVTLYFLGIKALFLLRPHFSEHWNPIVILGTVFGIPIDELLWAAGFAFTWPLWMSYVLDIKAA